MPSRPGRRPLRALAVAVAVAACALLAAAGCQRQRVPDEREAVALFMAGRIPEALPGFLALAHSQPADRRWSDAVAACYEKLGDWPAAIQFFEPLAAGPEAPHGHRVSLGYFRCKAAHYSAALALLRAAVEEQPSDAKAQVAYVRCLSSAGPFDERLSAAERASAALPGEPLVWIELALALNDADRAADTARALAAAIGTGRASATAYRLSGVLALKRADLVQARSDLERAVALEGGEPDNVYQLANVLFRSGDPAAAAALVARLKEARR